MLDPVAGEVEQPHAALAPQAAGEGVDGLVHGPLVRIRMQFHLEAQGAQFGGDVPGVVDRIGQGPLGVGPVADHQGHPARLGSGRRGPQ